MSEPPNSSEWLNLAVNSVNFPASVVSMSQRPILLKPAAISPKLISRVFCAGASSTKLPVSVKLISRPWLFSMILGWAESILRLLAAAYPVFLTRTPSVNGSTGSMAGVSGSSPHTSWVRK